MISCGGKSFVEVVDVDDAQQVARDDDDDDDDDNDALDGFEEEADREECNLLSSSEMPEQE